MKIIATSGYKSFIGNNFYYQYKKKLKIFRYKKNINNVSEIKKFILKKKITHFINFASLSRLKCTKYKSECIKTNFKSIRSIIKMFNTLDIKPILIFISSSLLYKSSNLKLNEKSKIFPTSLYSKTKFKSEEYIKKNYNNFVILRLFNVYGPKQPKSFFITDMIEKIKKKQTIVIDKSIKDFIHVNTVSKIIKFVIIKDIKGIVNVGSGKGYSLISLINQIGRKLKIKPKLKILDKKTKIVADINFLKKKGFVFNKNEKNFNF